MHDPGEAPQAGGLLWARYGKGTFVYTGLAFFRQLPAGVPGAYRLFANLLAGGHRRDAPLTRSRLPSAPRWTTRRRFSPGGAIYLIVLGALAVEVLLGAALTLAASMSALDWVVLFGTLAAIVVYGLWKTRGPSSMTDYLHGGYRDRLADHRPLRHGHAG